MSEHDGESLKPERIFPIFRIYLRGLASGLRFASLVTTGFFGLQARVPAWLPIAFGVGAISALLTSSWAKTQ